MKGEEKAFKWLHEVPWGQQIKFDDFFSLTKMEDDLIQWNFHEKYDLVYFDAFAPGVQPQLWTAGIFTKIYAAMKPNSVLVTYSSKGSVRRILEGIGFIVERLPGPPGKRQIMRAIKL